MAGGEGGVGTAGRGVPCLAAGASAAGPRVSCRVSALPQSALRLLPEPGRRVGR